MTNPTWTRRPAAALALGLLIAAGCTGDSNEMASRERSTAGGPPGVGATGIHSAAATGSPGTGGVGSTGATGEVAPGAGGSSGAGDPGVR